MSHDDRPALFTRPSATRSPSMTTPAARARGASLFARNRADVFPQWRGRDLATVGTRCCDTTCLPWMAAPPSPCCTPQLPRLEARAWPLRGDLHRRRQRPAGCLRRHLAARGGPRRRNASHRPSAGSDASCGADDPISSGRSTTPATAPATPPRWPAALAGGRRRSSPSSTPGFERWRRTTGPHRRHPPAVPRPRPPAGDPAQPRPGPLTASSGTATSSSRTPGAPTPCARRSGKPFTADPGGPGRRDAQRTSPEGLRITPVRGRVGMRERS